MARTVNRFYNTVIGSVFSLFVPVSLYETLLYCLIAFAFAMIARVIWRLARREMLAAISTLMVILIAALSVMGIYNFTAGFAYNRAEMPMAYAEKTVNILDARAVAEDYIAELAALTDKMEFDEETGYVVCPYPYAQLNKVLQKEYARLTDGYFTAFTPNVKKIASGWVMSNMHLTGVAFSPFGEANVNSLTPTRSLPVVMAHEIAHIKGVMREDDANLLAYYICLTAEDDFVRYCGYAYTVMNVLNATYSRSDNYYSETYYARVPEPVRRERTAINSFWASYTLFDDIADWFNDLYLKFNGTGGTSDYVDPGSTIVEDPDTTPIEEQTVSLSRVQRMIFKAIK